VQLWGEVRLEEPDLIAYLIADWHALRAPPTAVTHRSPAERQNCRPGLESTKFPVKLLREVVWVILDQFRMAVFFCSCRCGHVGNALALSIMSTALLDARAVDL